MINSTGCRRFHTYLRISLTERCNLRCQYCMPAEGIDLTPSEDLLTAQEIGRLVRCRIAFDHCTCAADSVRVLNHTASHRCARATCANDSSDAIEGKPCYMASDSNPAPLEDKRQHSTHHIYCTIMCGRGAAANECSHAHFRRSPCPAVCASASTRVLTMAIQPYLTHLCHLCQPLGVCMYAFSLGAHHLIRAPCPSRVKARSSPHTTSIKSHTHHALYHPTTQFVATRPKLSHSQRSMHQTCVQPDPSCATSSTPHRPSHPSPRGYMHRAMTALGRHRPGGGRVQAGIFVAEGVDKIRLTGGEPTLRKDLEPIARELGALPGLKTLAMTSNGVALRRKLQPLAAAGLSALNISLDTLREDRFEQLTRRKGCQAVLHCVEEALAAGFAVKVNVVVMRGINEDEVGDFVELTRHRRLNVRFIEYMPFDDNAWSKDRMVRLGTLCRLPAALRVMPAAAA